jgi:hypothetical protein
VGDEAAEETEEKTEENQEIQNNPNSQYDIYQELKVQKLGDSFHLYLNKSSVTIQHQLYH